MGGFAFAKYEFKGQNVLFAMIIALISVPPFLNIIPFFQMMSTFGWINTWYPLIVPTMAAPFGIFLMSQFLKTEVPFQLMDSARIDGLSEFGIFLRIGAPLAKPAMSILGIVTFVGTWNNFLGALMAGTALSLLPVLLLYVFFARRIIGDLQAGALKG